MELPKYVSWVETRTVFGPVEFAAVTHVWVRLDPPARAWWNYIGGGHDYNVLDDQGLRHTADSWDKVALSAGRGITTDDLLHEVLVGYRSAGAAPPDEEPSKPSPWQRTEETLDGQPAIRYDLNRGQGMFRQSVTAWAEPATARLMRREERDMLPGTERPVEMTVCDRYTYDEPPPEGVFEMPAGKPVEPLDAHASLDAWAALDETQRSAITDMVSASEDAWRRGDWRAFRAAWRIPRASLLRRGQRLPVNSRPAESEWRERFRRDAGRWTEWRSAVKSASRGYIAVATSVSSSAMVPEPDAITTFVDAHVAWPGGVWEGRATYSLTPGRGGWRIVHWDFPWEELRDAVAAAP